MEKKIKSCYYEVNGKKFLVGDNSELLMEIGKNHRFYIDFESDENFEAEFIKEKRKPISTVKWAYILQYSFSKLKNDDSKEDIWGYFIKENGTTVVDKYGIGKNYFQSNEILFNPTSQENNFWEGSAYQLLVFVDDPSDGISFPFMAVKSSPGIRGVYFDKQNIVENNSEFGINDGYYNYNTTIRLYMSTHMLPLKSLPHDKNLISDGIDIDLTGEWKDFELTVELLDEISDTETQASSVTREYSCGDKYKFILDEPLIKEELSKHSGEQSSLNANTNFIIPINIELDWKDKFHKNYKQYPTKKYYVLVIIENKKTKVKYYNYPTNLTWNHTVENEIKELPTSHFFAVKYNSFDFILKEFEDKKTNQIQYIGDVLYQKKEFDPCGYSQIMITDEANQNRKPYILFDEDKLNSGGDNTSQTFDVIRGDNTSNVIISLKNLHNKNVFCNGVMLPKNQKHDTKENVFLMDTVLAAKRLGDDFERVEDKDHKKQLRKSDIKITKENETDTDVITDPTKPAYEVEKLQNLVVDTDYEYIGEDKLKLKLKYLYNKSYDNEILNYLSQDQKILQYNEFGKLVANIWVVRYLIKLTKSEDFFQTYFVPVSTCRYPNQIVKIRVFPDMKWVLNFNYNIEEPLYYNDSPTQLDYFDRSKNEFDDLSGNIRRAEEASIKKRVASAYHNLKSGFAFSLDCEVSGEAPIHLSKAFSEKYRNTLKPIFDIIEFLDNKLGVSKAKEEDERQTRTSASYVKRKGIRDLPVSFELKPPSLGIGASIGYSTDKNYIQTWGIEGRIIAAPLIGAEVRLDLLALGSKIKPWGVILDALDIAAWAAESLSGGRLEVDYKIEIVFESEVNLVGRKIGEDEETGESTYEKYGNIKCNFAEGLKGAIGDFNVQGIIKGRIEMSAKIEIKSKLTRKNIEPQEDKYNKKDELSIGAKAESYISLTIPTKCNAEGALDVDGYFSGVKLEFWFRATLHADETSSEPNYNKKIIDSIPINKTLKF